MLGIKIFLYLYENQKLTTVFKKIVIDEFQFGTFKSLQGDFNLPIFTQIIQLTTNKYAISFGHSSKNEEQNHSEEFINHLIANNFEFTETEL